MFPTVGGSIELTQASMPAVQCTSLPKAVWAIAFNSLYKNFIYSPTFLYELLNQKLQSCLHRSNTYYWRDPAGRYSNIPVCSNR